jgi:hypothetical protein
MVRYARGLSPRVKDRKALPCPPAGDEQNWRGAIEALRDALTHPNIGPADATVVLSNHFVRYLVLAWNPGLATPQEEEAFARARFVHAFGETAHDWVLRISTARPGMPSVASAIEPAFMQALTGQLDGSPLRLRSMQPSLMAVCNERARLPGTDAWIVIAEAGKLLLGALRDGRWLSLRTRPLQRQSIALMDILEQEAVLLGIEPGIRPVFLHRSADASLDLAGVQLHPWAPRRKVSG